MNLRWTILLILTIHLPNLLGQDIKRVHGEYTYLVPENISLDEGKRTAIERAKLQALEDAFGTTVSQTNSTFVKNTNGVSSIEFFSIGGSNLKGEWISTIGEPQTLVSSIDGNLLITVRIDGKAREIQNTKPYFQTKILKNGTSTKFEDDSFTDGDDLFLYFKSPINGYLTVFLLDYIDKKAYCLLPYKSSDKPNFPIVRDTPYIFFSSNEARDKTNEVDEYTMTCRQEVEQNLIVIIFSPHPFAKAIMGNQVADMPQQLSIKDFLNWLSNSRTKDKEMQVVEKVITIKKKKNE